MSEKPDRFLEACRVVLDVQIINLHEKNTSFAGRNHFFSERACSTNPAAENV